MQCQSCFFLSALGARLSSFDLQVRGPHNEVGLLKLAERLVMFQPGTFLFICNALTHWATLPKLGFSG